MRSRKRRFTGHQFCPPPYRTTRLHCKHCGQINWQFTFADFLRLPRHARACPMRAHTCTLPLWCRRRLDRQRSKPKLPQIRQEWRRRYGGKSRSTCWLDGGDLVVPVSSPSARPSRERLRAAVPASDSARPSQRATPRGRLASDSARTGRHSAAPSLHCARHFAAPTLCASLRRPGCQCSARHRARQSAGPGLLFNTLPRLAPCVPFRRPVLALCAPFRRPDTVRVTPPVRLQILPKYNILYSKFT